MDAVEHPYVEMIFRKFLEVKGIHLLANYLNENGFKTKEFVTKIGKKAGGNRWTISSLYALLTNRSYIAEREVNKKNRGVDTSDLKKEDHYFFVDAQWPALISKELFFDVQRLLEQNKNKARRYTHQYRLTGLIECEECGARLIGKSGPGKNGKYFYYGHMRKTVTIDNRHLHRCAIENIPALQIEEAIISRLKALSEDRDLLVELAKATASSSQTKNDHKRSLMAAKEQERRKLDQRVKNIYEAVADESDRTSRAGLVQKAKEEPKNQTPEVFNSR